MKKLSNNKTGLKNIAYKKSLYLEMKLIADIISLRSFWQKCNFILNVM